MIISDLVIRMGLFEKTFTFSDKSNLIFSTGNSVGKTTLVRLILYSLGYTIPGTKRFPIEKYEYKVHVTTDDGSLLELMRQSPEIMICDNGGVVNTYYLPVQLKQVHSLLYNTDNNNILDNIL